MHDKRAAFGFSLAVWMRQTKTDLLELDFVHRVIFAVDSTGLEDGYPDFALAVLAYLVATAEAAELAWRLPGSMVCLAHCQHSTLPALADRIIAGGRRRGRRACACAPSVARRLVPPQATVMLRP